MIATAAHIVIQDPAGPVVPRLHEPEAVDRAVEAVFARPDLERALDARPGAAEDLVARALAEIERLWRELQSWFGDLAIESPSLYYALLLALLALLGLLVWHLGWTVRSVLRAGAMGPAVEVATGRRSKDYRELRDEARALAAAGRRREALHVLLLALLALLEERRVLQVARGWTVREILGRLEHRAAPDAELRAFGRAVERSTYGGADLDADEFVRLEAAVERVAREARLAAPAGVPA